MNPHNSSLNLARSWRPQTFDEVIGQDLSIRILKTALYKEKWFPVYLFAGQRGCGKTSTARVFAAAVNCHQLATWRQKPTEIKFPCLECPSCKAFFQGKHPDFIEMDAASHTGVDDVRELTDSASYLPLIASKKVYLIDEAHMLSKAAFNALLKILEEPPASVLFILATTEIQKIPDTVRSRCFQIIFSPISTPNLKQHLQNICDQEQITIDDDALTLLINHCEGSARDAINLLEKVRFTQDQVTKETVLKVLGKMSETTLYEVFLLMANQEPHKLLTFLKTISFDSYDPAIIWGMFVDLFRTLIWVKYGVPVSQTHSFNDTQSLERLAALCTHSRLNGIMTLFWSQEELFLKTPYKHLFLEMLLLQVCQQVAVEDLDKLLKGGGGNGNDFSTTSNDTLNRPTIKSSLILSPSKDMSTPTQSYASMTNAPDYNEAVEPDETVIVQTTNIARAEPSSNPSISPVYRSSESEGGRDSNTSSILPTSPTFQPWEAFTASVDSLQDRLTISIFKQMKFIEWQEATKTLVVQIHKDSPFFKDKISETTSQWKPLLEAQLPGCQLSIQAPPPGLVQETTPRQSSNEIRTLPVETRGQPSPQIKSQPYQSNSYQKGGSSYNSSYKKQTPPVKRGAIVDISDTSKWPKANLIAQTFSVIIEKFEE